MSQAVIVHEAYKQFNNPYGQIWKRMPRLPARFNSQTPLPDLRPVIVVLDHVSFSVAQGEIFGIVGPSGAGKSTLVRLLAALLLPDSGDIRVFGYDVASQPVQVQRLTNPVSVEASYFQKLSPVDNLIYCARRHGQVEADTYQQVTDVLVRLGFSLPEMKLPMERLRRDQQQKVVIAGAILCQPRLLLLDEPTAGLDDLSKRQVRALLRELKAEHGVTMIIATRDQTEAEQLCDRYVYLENGRLVMK